MLCESPASYSFSLNHNYDQPALSILPAPFFASPIGPSTPACTLRFLACDFSNASELHLFLVIGVLFSFGLISHRIVRVAVISSNLHNNNIQLGADILKSLSMLGPHPRQGWFRIIAQDLFSSSSLSKDVAWYYLTVNLTCAVFLISFGEFSFVSGAGQSLRTIREWT